MTLIIAADTQDHLILAGDHCAVLSRVSNQGEIDLVLDDYRKVYQWKYGAIASSGDVFLMVYFCRLFLFQERLGQPIDLLQVAKEAKAARSRCGVPHSRSTGNIFFTMPGRGGFVLYGLYIGESKIELEIIEPISACFSLRQGVSDVSVYNAFISQLRPSFFFCDAEEFHAYHLDLLKAFFAGQSAVDELVTASFDVCMFEKRTGMGTYWQISESLKQLAFVELPVNNGTRFTSSADPEAI